MVDNEPEAAARTAEEILLATEPEVQEVVKATLKLARRSAAGSGAITKDDVVEIIRNVVK